MVQVRKQPDTYDAHGANIMIFSSSILCVLPVPYINWETFSRLTDRQ